MPKIPHNPLNPPQLVIRIHLKPTHILARNPPYKKPKIVGLPLLKNIIQSPMTCQSVTRSVINSTSDISFTQNRFEFSMVQSTFPNLLFLFPFPLSLFNPSSHSRKRCSNSKSLKEPCIIQERSLSVFR